MRSHSLVPFYEYEELEPAADIAKRIAAREKGTDGEIAGIIWKWWWAK